MIDQKIETFLTQLKSLDVLSLSLIDELRLLKAQSELMRTENAQLKAELIACKALLQSSQTEEAQKPKSKKTVSKSVQIDTPSLF